MKIFYICDNDLSRQAGDTVHITEICENLQKLGHEIVLYAPKLGYYREEVPFRIEYIFTFAKGKKRFLMYQLLLSFFLLYDILIKKPDIIFCRASWSPASLFISKLFRKPYIIEILAVDISKRKINFIFIVKNSLLRFLSNLNIKFADMIITTTEGNAERIGMYYAIDKKKIKVVSSGVNIDLFKDMDCKKARESLGLAQDIYYIGATGSIFNYSGIDTLIECLPLILSSTPNLKVILAGRDETRGHISDLIARLKFENDILYVGEVLYSKIPLYVAALDIGLQLDYHTPEFWRGDPIKLYEYFALGKAVVVSNTYKDFIEKVNAGIAVDVNKPEEITEAIISLINDEKRRAMFGENGRRFVLENRTWRLSAVKTAMICENLLKAK